MSEKCDNNDRDDDSGYERTPSPATSLTTSTAEDVIVAKQFHTAKTRDVGTFKSTDHRRCSGNSSDVEKQAKHDKVPDIGRTGREVHAASSCSTGHAARLISEAEANQGRVVSGKRVLGIKVREAERCMATVVPTKKKRHDIAATCESSPSVSTSASVKEARTPKAEDLPETYDYERVFKLLKRVLRSATPTSVGHAHTTECDPEELQLFYSRPIYSNRPSSSDDEYKKLRMFLSSRMTIDAIEKMEESPALRTALFGETVPDPYGALRVYRNSQSHSIIRRPPG